MFAMEAIEPMEFAIEYVGELIRVPLADARERVYQVRLWCVSGVLMCARVWGTPPRVWGELIRAHMLPQALGMDDYMFRVDHE